MQDTELWYRNGNCYIHLYGQGQSRRGPAFKIPFSGLLEADCYPLIDRFMARGVQDSTGNQERDNGDPARQSRIELFIPAPPRSDKQQSYRYHLATRNFIAFVFRRSVVGENLGTALITLMHSMHEFRTDTVDNVQDMMSYMDEEGYLNLQSNPTHALAILRLAEAFQLKDLYINAFAHCCGMSDRILAVPEYQVSLDAFHFSNAANTSQLVSSVTRKLIRCGRVEMNLKLGQSSNMVGTFLQYELSEAHLGLYPGVREHLERFRTLLREFYTAKFGSYPPPSVDIRTTIFEIDIFQEMRADFEALFRYLVDETFDITQSSPFLARGGICTWQSIQSFDTRHDFKTLFNPLPRLPSVTQERTRKPAWLGGWIGRGHKQQEVTHTALLRAANHKVELLHNGLVRVYRQFEGDLVHLSRKADRSENLGPMDSRKVRWILIYGIYQALRQATEIPPEVGDSDDAPYPLCISTADLPPWDEGQPAHGLIRRQTEHILRSTSIPAGDRSSTREPTPHNQSLEIKPDIDYFAITHRGDNAKEAKEERPKLRQSTSWRGNLSRNISRSQAPHSSPAKLTKPRPTKNDQSTKNTPYHEIVIQGYGNGTRGIGGSPVDVPSPAVRPTVEEEVISTSPSRYSYNADSRNSEEGSVARTLDTSIYESPLGGPVCVEDSRRTSSTYSHNDSASRRSGPSSSTGTRPRRAEDKSLDPACGLLRRWPRSVEESDPRKTKAKANANAKTKIVEPTPPTDVRKVYSVASHIDMPTPRTPTPWDQVKSTMEVKATNWTANDVHPEWEQYTDLGGLTVLKSGTASKQKVAPTVHF